MHLGKRARGMAHKDFKTGEYSRYLQVIDPVVAERYRAIQAEADYLSLAPDIHMVKTLIDETMLRVRSGESGKAWRDAREAFNRFMDAQEAKNRDASMAALLELRAALDVGNKERDALADLDRLWSRLQRLVESQRRRAIEHGELVSLAIVLTMLRTSAESFRRHLAHAQIDPTTRDTILNHVSGDLARITGGTISGVASPGPNGSQVKRG